MPIGSRPNYGNASITRASTLFSPSGAQIAPSPVKARSSTAKPGTRKTTAEVSATDETGCSGSITARSLGSFKLRRRSWLTPLSRLGGEIDKLSDQDKNRATRAMQCQTLVNLQWQEIDVLPLLDRISTIERQIREAREGNTTLLQISEQIGEAKEAR
jgi:hypothetical protein